MNRDFYVILRQISNKNVRLGRLICVKMIYIINDIKRFTSELLCNITIWSRASGHRNGCGSISLQKGQKYEG